MRYSIKSKILITFFIVLSYSIIGQNFPSKNINLSDGLPNNQVGAILKDSRGILWVGTHNGLSKIENSSIENFFVEDGLAHNSTRDILEDTNGNIWIGSYGGGVTSYDGNQFTVYNAQKGLANNFVRKLFEYKNYILVGAKNGVSIINLDDHKVETIKTEGENFQVMDFFVYDDEVYCGTFREGIFKIDIENKSVKEIYSYAPRSNALFSIYIKDSLFYYSIDGANSDLKMGTLKKFKIDNLLNNKSEDLMFGKSIIWDYATDSDNNLYGAAWGVYANNGGVYQIKNDTFINKTIDFGITSSNVTCLYFDKEYNFLYAGTTDKGLFQVDLNKTINYIKNDELEIVDIENSQSNLALLIKTSLVIIKDNKIVNQVFNSEFLKFVNDNIQKKLISYHIKNNTKFQEINFFKIVNYNSFYWVSTNIGLFKLSYDGTILGYNPQLTINFEFDNNGNLLTPIPYSSFRIYPNFKEKESQIYHGDSVNTPVSVSGYSKLNNKIFITTVYKGLFLYENKEFVSLNSTNDFTELELDHIALIGETNTLAISTSAGDVYLADVNDSFKILKKLKREMIIGNSILFLETYKEALLIGTDKGLNIYSSGVLQFIDEEQGIKNTNLTSSKIIDKNLIIGTNNGYYKIDLNKLLNRKSEELKLSVTNISVNHQPIDRTEYNWFTYTKKQLELNHDENRLSIDFSASNHPYPKKLLYSYQIEHLDTTWSKFLNETNIFLSYIPSGKYNVNVRVKDLNSGVTAASKLINIKVHPPFWVTWWFITGVLFMLVNLAIVAYINRINYIENREQQKSKIQKRIVETKLEALQSQMNPHFTFNAMNSIQNYTIDNDVDNALMYLGEFAKLIRLTLENSSKPLITLSEEISYLKSYIALENMRFNDKVEISFNYDEIEVNEIELPPMLIQPFIENVFVHAFNKEHQTPKLSINFTINNDLLICKVIDNGIGMSETKSGQLHQSKGLKLVTERLNLLNNSSSNSFNISSEKGKGTAVTLQFELI